MTTDNMTLVEAVRTLGDDDKAEQFFIATRWPNGIACPNCGSLDIYECPNRKPQPFRCRDCRKHFSVKTDTLMHGSPLPLSKWALAMYLLSANPKGYPSTRMARDIGVSQKTAWFLNHRIREAWASGDQDFVGPVEVDEAYVAGKEKNRHARHKLKSGNMTAKTVVIGAKDRDTNRVKTAVLESVTTNNLQWFVTSNVEDMSNTPVFTDGHSGYVSLPTKHHGVVQHSIGHYVEYVDGGEDIHTNGIEAFWSMLKRGYIGVYHYFSPKHTHRYATEFEGRHNAKDLSLWEQIKALVLGTVGKRLTWAKLVSKRGHSLSSEYRNKTQAEAFRHLSSGVIERQRQRDHDRAQAEKEVREILAELGLPYRGDYEPPPEPPSDSQLGVEVMKRYFKENPPIQP